MPSRTVSTEYERRQLLRYLEGLQLPFAVDISRGRRRSVEQNRLQRLLCNEIAEQLGDSTPEEVRGLCKLMFGVPILRAASEKFRERYDEILKPLPYEAKLAVMMEPLDLHVTRLMTVAQKSAYLDAIYRHYTEQGLVLTVPDDLGRAA